MLLKIKEFCLKNKMWLGLSVVSMLAFLSLIWSAFEWVCIAAIALFALTCSVKEAFCFSFFTMAFSGLGVPFVVATFSTLVAVFIKYIKDVKNGSKQIYKFPIIFSLIFLCIFSLINYGIDFEGVTFGLMIAYIVVLSYFVFIYHKEISIEQCFNFILIGIIISVALSLLSLPIDSFKKDIYYYDGIYNRYMFLTHHFNNLSIHSMFQIAFSIYSLFNKKRKVWIDVIAIVVSLICGILTMSKAFLLIVFLLIIYSFIAIVLIFKKKCLKYIAIMFGVIVLGVIIGWRYIGAIIDRFTLYFNDGSKLNMITTGRFEVWKGYLEEWLSTPAKILFGVGMFTKQPMFSSAHNVLVFLLHRFGIVGIMMIIVLIAAYITSSQSKIKVSFFNCLILCLWFIVSVEENMLSDQFTIYLLFGLMLVTYEVHTQKKEIVNDEEINVSLVDNSQKIEDNKNVVIKNKKIKNSTKNKIKT